MDRQETIMSKPPFCITIWFVVCMLRTSISMSVVLLTPDTIATTISEGENQGTVSTLETIPTAFPGDENPPQQSGTEQLNCTFKELQPEDVIQLGTGGKLLIKSSSSKLTLTLTQTYVHDPAQNVCYIRGELLNQKIFATCEKWEYTEDEFSVQDNGIVQLFEDVLEPGSYSIHDGLLQRCADAEDGDEGDNTNSTGHVPTQKWDQDTVSTYIGQVCCTISIVALTAHLVSFCLVPSMRNLPGYNLASLSVAFLLGYLFSLIGQIPEVLGFFCVLCGILVQYFLLAAFFCMNTLAFDVWRTLKMATTKLVMSSHNAKRRQFLYYSIYSWGVPFVITTISVMMDNIRATPNWIRPDFGKHDICWMTNIKAKMAFFTVPSFALFVANALFFVLSAFIIRNNTMKATSDEQRQAARNNFILYLRLGIMMGITWLFSVISAISNDSIVWLLSDIMNALQGLFVFLMFTCSKKVIDHVRDKMQLHATLRTPKSSTTDLSGRKISSSDGPVKSIEIRPYIDPIKSESK